METNEGEKIRVHFCFMEQVFHSQGFTHNHFWCACARVVCAQFLLKFVQLFKQPTSMLIPTKTLLKCSALWHRPSNMCIYRVHLRTTYIAAALNYSPTKIWPIESNQKVAKGGSGSGNGIPQLSSAFIDEKCTWKLNLAWNLFLR